MKLYDQEHKQACMKQPGKFFFLKQKCHDSANTHTKTLTLGNYKLQH